MGRDARFSRLFLCAGLRWDRDILFGADRRCEGVQRRETAGTDEIKQARVGEHGTTLLADVCVVGGVVRLELCR